MNIRTSVIRGAAAVIILAGALVACGNDQPACAASVGTPPKPPKVNPPKPQQQRTTSKVQDRPKTAPKTQKKAAPKPTNWSGYNDRVKQRNWSTPYRKGYPTAPQPIIIHQYGNDYRTYPGYYGYYPVGVWPVGYGAKFGCTSEREDTPAPAQPTSTVTVTTSPTPSESDR